MPLVPLGSGAANEIGGRYSFPDPSLSTPSLGRQIYKQWLSQGKELKDERRRHGENRKGAAGSKGLAEMLGLLGPRQRCGKRKKAAARQRHGSRFYRTNRWSQT